MKLLKLCAAAIVATFAQPALAANCATVTFTGPTAVSGWNPLTSSTGTATFTATATRDTNGTTRRSARIIFLDNDTGTTVLNLAGTPNGPRYEIRDSASSVVSAPSGTAPPSSSTGAQFSWGNSGSNVSGPITLSVSILPNSSNQDFIGGTIYTEALKYSIQCFAQGGGLLLSDMGVAGAPTLSLTIPKVISLTSASSASVNFGNFTATTDTVQIKLKSTSSVNVGVETLYGTASANQMVLAGASSPYSPNSTIPYSMMLNGTAVFHGSLRPNQTRGGQSETTYPLVLTLSGIPSGKIAGNYSDTITLTLTPGS